MPTRAPQAVFYLGLLLLSAVPAHWVWAADTKKDAYVPLSIKEQQELDARVASLIRELGADEFATRERAQAELQRMGLTAFDALHEAQTDEDIEVAMRARYLVRSMSVSWSVDSDTANVRKILKNYGDQREEERKSRMEQLARLDNYEGTPALCRLVRFETSIVLSKHAALLILQQPAPADEETIETFVQHILGSLALSKRAAARWLRTHLQTLKDPASTVAKWAELAAEEQEVFTQFPNHSERQIVRDLLRWQVDLLLKLGRKEESLDYTRRTVELMDGTREQLLETVDWLLERNAYAVVDEVAGRYPDQFDEYAQLLYRLAEAQRKRENEQLARVTAERAFALNPEDLDEHIRTGYALQDRGMFDWAEREYRALSKKGPPGSKHDLDARFMLSEMLHDLRNDLEAAKVLQGVVDAMENDPNVLKAIERHPFRDPGGTRSRLNFFYACHHAAANDPAHAMELLTKGWQADPHDADVLIAMFRLPGGDAAWKELTSQRIKTSVEHFRTSIARHSRETEEAPSTIVQEWAFQKLAQANNQLAWLIANTEGDFDEAIRCSHRSLEIRPETAGYLDTLGRCYFAKGDYANAVKYQSKAAKLDPFSGQLQRQLKEFQKALAETQGKPAEGSKVTVQPLATATYSRSSALAQGGPRGHWTILVISAAVILLSICLQVRERRQVALPGVVALPDLCMFKRLTGHGCPGCGLTRCFISLGKGDLDSAWSHNPAGIALFLVIALQVPYRAAILWRLRTGRLLRLRHQPGIANYRPHGGERTSGPASRPVVSAFQQSLGMWSLMIVAALLLLQWIIRLA